MFYLLCCITEQHDLDTSLPSLISGLESCRQLLGEALVDGNTRVSVWDQVRKAGQLCAELAKNGGYCFNGKCFNGDVCGVTY